MVERELIYKDEARREVKQDDYWIARVKYWPGDKEHIIIVKIFYAWKDGGIQFVPFGGEEGDPIWATSCQLFELLERIEADKYK